MGAIIIFSILSNKLVKFSHPQKALPCAEPRRMTYLSAKIGPTSASLGARMNREKKNMRRFWVYISRMWGAKIPRRIDP